MFYENERDSIVTLIGEIMDEKVACQFHVYVNQLFVSIRGDQVRLTGAVGWQNYFSYFLTDYRIKQARFLDMRWL